MTSHTEPEKYLTSIEQLRNERTIMRNKLNNITNEINSGNFYGNLLQNKRYYRNKFQEALVNIKSKIKAHKNNLQDVYDKVDIKLDKTDIKHYDSRKKITQRKALEGKINEYTINNENTKLKQFDEILEKRYKDISVLNEQKNISTENKEIEQKHIKDKSIEQLIQLLLSICFEPIKKEFMQAVINRDVMTIHMSLKYNCSTEHSDDHLETRYANSDSFILKTTDDINQCVHNLIENFEKSLSNGASNTVYMNIEHFRFNTAHQNKKIYEQKNTGSYIPLEDKVAKSQSCINVKNLDDKCIEYCIMSFLFHDELAKSKNILIKSNDLMTLLFL
jgi:hypothetical protein